MAKCGSCRYFDGVNFCSLNFFALDKEDPACGFFKGKHAKFPDVYIPDEEKIPLEKDGSVFVFKRQT